ncbi:MAG: hypothetical protein LBM39_00850 [Candidatus Methanoplasma sp.]|jgi:hypothetical protein|nr:hypothetical protein [Candidatus Methanoplasma sp.]
MSHHDHDHEGHDHEHHHDHDHDHEGHDHDGDHKHEEDTHTHDDHESLHLELHRAVDELGKYAIEIDIVSETGIPKETIRNVIEETMRSSTENCLHHGADLIGHTKSFLYTDNGSIMSSLLDERTPIRVKDNVIGDEIKSAKYILHVIVHGIWDDKVRENTLEVLPGIFEKWNVPYKVVADYYDLEKSIAHHL